MREACVVEIMMRKITLDDVILNDAERECAVGHGSPTGLELAWHV